MNLGEWIRRIQFEKGIDEEECYTRAGMTQPNWSRLVNNPPKQPRKSTMEAIARALDEPVGKVFAAAGYDDNAEMDVRLARRLTPLLMQAHPTRRSDIEAAIEQVTRVMVGAHP